MHAVNVRQLKSNPSVALRAAKSDLVVVMNRDTPDAVQEMDSAAAWLAAPR